ncbi:ubiquitin-associated domain-containing protein 1 isoform X2 [Nasonia vitripennis]|uniref:UBA domain-containing protein n=1 Tax=Nasonia vitripennis TaxID=7425 RepID=A0A7M7TDF6_NASVI|nr:ubiquitin-associated domain-containing protein 1 isoform X2 [Nasonia vitripennis]XP_032455433.1 ubiquitin-associated domain-containing protein 1 isoform X2 [Nasonia vitripennis]XP_032455436.1 ubiquitin-associated domain-containing protein 1 isoform X2 [Nasonia vitripennis]XP_032455438.1 ubiquitin-associated domain-containing protein 1 isoform X2 [Nasonia vitripennis]XP_032455442.1 ubiquitin-associated domain-containing protein 1 isoform X2 [Nasonia vitripennis]
MFPWVKEQITEAWNNRKSSRSAKKHSLNGSSEDPGGMQTSSATSESFLINVISLDGGVLYVAVTLDFTVDKVKSIATEHFYGHDKTRPASQFRLVHATMLKPLTDEKNLGEEEISESDELLLVEVRPAAEKENLTEDALKGPTDEEILNATKHLPVRNPAKPAITSECPADFQSEIRKILITLVQASAKILMYSSEADEFYEIIKEKLEAQLKPPNDPKAVKYLVDMGFSERKALKALRLRKMNTSEALEWLLEHQDDPDDDDDIELPSIETVLNEAGPSSSDNETLQKKPNLVHIVNLILDSFHQYQKMDFKPSATLVQSLEEMGFAKEEVLETLKITGNNHANACAWLLGERRPSLQNLYEGMDPEGPIYDAIMNNPQIQLSLTNPKMLLAYLSMLETPTSTSLWMKDPQVSPVLSQIFKTYHAEKHAIHVNRYDDS